MSTEFSASSAGPTRQNAAQSEMGADAQEPFRRGTLKARIREKCIIVESTIPADVSKALGEVAWSVKPIEDLRTSLEGCARIEHRRLIRLVALTVLAIAILVWVIATVIAVEFETGKSPRQAASMSALLLNIILLGIGLKLYAFDYHMQRSRLLGTLLSAIGLCIDLQRRKNDVYIRGRLARQIDAASARFHFAYTRLPGHHIKPYSQELKKRASAGSQAIASTTSLLFCGSDELADLRDRLCRMTLRVSANDWLSIEQLVVGEGARKRMRPFGILLEPATIPLLVTALTLITAIVSVVGKALE